MNSLLERIYDTSSVEDAEGNLINPFPTATPYEIGMVFNELIRKYNLERTLEVGMAYGLSTLFICQAHHDKGTGSHTAIDPFQDSEWKSIGALNIKRSGLEDRFRLFQAYSYEVLPQLLTQGEQFDFAFIDGSHFFDYALVDFFYIDKLLQPGGYLVFDDMWMPSIRKVVYFVLRNRAYELVNIYTSKTMWKRVKRITRRFLENPFEVDYTGYKYITENICILKKISEDSRDGKLYRSF